MKMFMKMVLVVSGLLLVGCGGGGGTPENNTGDTNRDTTIDNTQAYQNNKLPSIGNDIIPEVLLKSSGIPLGKLKKQYKETALQSLNFLYLKEKARFFYQKQLEMNIDLSYFDSVWSQIEEYCQSQDICSIPDNQIVFTYTKALYLHDLELIKNYEEKTDDLDKYRYYAQDMEGLVDQSFKLAGVELSVYDEAEYKYELIIQNFNTEDMGDHQEKNIVKWNEDKTKYLYRVEVSTSKGELNYDQFQYFETVEEKISKYTSNNSGLYNESLEFIEKDGMISFIQDEPNEDDMISFYSEGRLGDTGGDMTIVGAGETNYEKFDEEGTLLSRVNCMDQVKDLNNIPENAFCSITDPDIIKSHITKNVYGLVSAVFEDDTTFSPTSSPSSKNMVKFENNNTLFAIVDCSTFTADYNISNTGIKFSNIVRTISPDLQCLYPKNEEKFEDFLNNGYNQGYSTAFDFWPLFDNAGSAVDFNKTKFNEQLHAEMFVDSPLMNSIFKIQSAQEYSHVATGKGFVLKSFPQVKAENEKIMFDLVDATFEADIEVVDPTHIRFSNIERVDKSDVIYPEDINLTCTEENIGTPNECMEDPYYDSTNSDKVFADIVERFLNETIEVNLYTTKYEDIRFSGEELEFIGMTRMPEPTLIKRSRK